MAGANVGETSKEDSELYNDGECILSYLLF